MYKSFKNLNNLTLKDENLIPHYQPILNTISREIYGYEVLGRYFVGDEKNFYSLGALFHDKDVNLSEKVQIDRIIRNKAVKYLKTSNSETKLFINMMPNLLSTLHSEDLDPIRFHIIQLVEKYKINKRNIVLEITEDEFQGSFDKLLKIISVFREYGFRIALDDVGAGFSNLERIGYIHPDILKVDIKLMRESLSSNSFLQVLGAVSNLSAKLGAELLFEGIENENELNLGFKMGASLLQGFYFSKASDKFISKTAYSQELKKSLEKFSGLRFIELVEFRIFVDSNIQLFLVFLSNLEIEFKKTPTISELLNSQLNHLPDEIYEVFITDFHGYKISPIFINKEKKWFIKESANESNFAWKPFFIEHKAETYHHKKIWSITETLFDIENQCKYLICCFTFDSDKIIIAKLKLS